MQTYQVRTTISGDGVLTVTGLPFKAGEKVKVTIHSSKHPSEAQKRYPLRGTPIRYIDPFGSVAESEWMVLN